jgi:exocyst complex component 2
LEIQLAEHLAMSLCQNHRIRGLLEKCSLDHETNMETLHNEIRERAVSDARWRQIQQALNQSVSVTIIGAK